MRKIPSTMASQHPDHANVPYWHDKAFIGVQDEYTECYLSYSDLGIDEYKWDWEGKFVDESVIERLFSEHYDYFKKHPLGKEKFLTFRLPNPKVETEFRIGRAFLGILGAAALAEQVGMHDPPLFEVILPMTESAEEMLSVQEAFKEISALKHSLYRFKKDNPIHLELIPLFEKVDTMIDSDEILAKYIRGHEKLFGRKPTYMRPYVARSDPALNSGIVPTVLAVKIALSRYHTFSEEHEIPLYPIIGSASLPFRGSLTPLKTADFLNEYKGIRTALIQSGFKYDYEKKDVVKAIKLINETLPKNKARIISSAEEKKLQAIITEFEPYYRSTVEKIAPIINSMAALLPRRRERVQHIGLFGYSRGVGKVKLPRAIGFTAALYSLGVPPEFIGTGRGIKAVEKKKLMPVVEDFYINFKQDMLRAGEFLNKKVLAQLAKDSEGWKEVQEDVSEVEKYLGVEFSPQTSEGKKHAKLVEKMHKGHKENKVQVEDIVEAGKLRRSLG